MIRLRSKIFLTVTFLLPLWYPLKAQQVVRSTPLHYFFQANYDSTILYHSSSSWNNSANYLIIAKQKERVYFFTYVSPYRGARGTYYPGKLTAKFSQDEQRFRRTLPDTNRYFLPKPIPFSTLSRSWRLLRPHRFWIIKDDQERREAGKCTIDDGDEHTFYLIDKKAIKVASFYAPDFFEKCLGKNLGRQQAITTRNILRALQQNGFE